VRQALDRLEESVRTSLELTYFEGLTAAETAEQMCVPEGTVRSRIARGIAALEQLLRDLEGTAHDE
jgi:RNA polymerase sigma factor (sigma-70 family)